MNWLIFDIQLYAMWSFQKKNIMQCDWNSLWCILATFYWFLLSKVYCRVEMKIYVETNFTYHFLLLVWFNTLAILSIWALFCFRNLRLRHIFYRLIRIPNNIWHEILTLFQMLSYLWTFDLGQTFEKIESCVDHLLELSCTTDQLKHFKEEHNLSSNVEEYKDSFHGKANKHFVGKKAKTGPYNLQHWFVLHPSSFPFCLFASWFRSLFLNFWVIW